MDSGDAQDFLSRAIEPWEASKYILELVLETVLGSYEDERALQGDVLNKIVTTCADDCLTIVAMAEVSREGPAAPGNWYLEDEPPSCACDTWARGSLPVKQRVRAPLVESAAPKQRRASNVNAHYLDSKRPSAPIPPGALLGVPRGKYAASVTSANSQRLKQPSKEDVSPPGPSKQEETDYEIRLRTELEYRRQQQAASRQQEVREQEERARLQNMINKEMRGKDFSYDHRGEVVVMNKLDPDKLPPADLMLSYKVVDSAGPAQTGGRGTRRSSVVVPTAAIARPLKKGDLARKPTSSGPDFVPLTSAGEFVRSDLIGLQPGVTLKFASLVKSGPGREVQVGRPLTKAEYFSAVGGGFVGEEVRPLSPSSTRGQSRVNVFGTIEAEGSDEAAGAQPGRPSGGVDPNDPAAVVASYLRPTSQDRARLFADAVPSPERPQLPPIARPRSSRAKGATAGGQRGVSPNVSAEFGTGKKVPPVNQKRITASPREMRAAGLGAVKSQQSVA